MLLLLALLTPEIVKEGSIQSIVYEWQENLKAASCFPSFVFFEDFS